MTTNTRSRMTDDTRATPCTQCGTAVTIYPPEDGDGPAMCGRCAHKPTAVIFTREGHNIMTDTITRKFNVGDRVEVDDDHFLAPYAGTVTKVEPGAYDEPVYTVRKVDMYGDSDTFGDFDLRPADENFVDLDERTHVLAELRDTVTRIDQHGGLDAADYLERARQYGRVSFLAGRLAWLDAIDQEHKANQERYGTK